MKPCPHCKQQIPRDAKYCPYSNCGQAIHWPVLSWAWTQLGGLGLGVLIGIVTLNILFKVTDTPPDIKIPDPIHIVETVVVEKLVASEPEIIEKKVVETVLVTNTMVITVTPPPQNTPAPLDNVDSTNLKSILDEGIGGDIVYAPDDNLVVHVSREGVDLYRQPLIKVTFIPKETPAKSAAFSPDNTLLALGLLNGKIQVWHIEKEELLYTLKGHYGPVNSVAFSAQGQLLASGSTDKSIRIWRVSDGRVRYILHGHRDWITSLAFSPKGSQLASASRDDMVYQWRFSGGHYHLQKMWQSKNIRSIAFTPEGGLVASIK